MAIKPTKRGWQILDAIDAFLMEWRDFLESPGNTFSDELKAALRSMLDTFAKGDIPAGFIRLKLQVDEVQHQVDLLPHSNLAGSSGFARAVDMLIEVRNGKDTTPQQPKESIASLMKLDGMHEFQVAKMYGLMDVNAKPRVDLVQRELASPGSVVDPDTGLVREQVEGWERPVEYPPCRLPDPNATEAEPVDVFAPEPPPAKRQPAPESMDELLALDVSDDQIAKMKMVPVEEVRKARVDRDLRRRKAQLETEKRKAEEALAKM